MITVGSLFSGIGGIDLGLERAGMTVKWQSEIDPYACKVLKKHWPDIPNLGDIKQIDWSTVEPVDVIAGGYPCQPFSTAGKRQGENDPRHLWPYFRDAISGIRPRFAILENVRGHLSMGFDRVLADLTEIGYDAEWEIVSAESVGAPHRRDRLICLAYSKEFSSNGRGCGNGVRTIREWSALQNPIGGSSSDVAYADDSRSRTSRTDADGNRSEDVARWNDEPQSELGRFGQNVAYSDSRQTCGRLGSSSTDTGQVRQQRDHFGGEEGYAGGQWWAVEPSVGRVAHGVPFRVERLRGLGNAVVPQVAETVGRIIHQLLT